MKTRNVERTKNIVGMRAIHRGVSLLVLLIFSGGRVFSAGDIDAQEWRFSLDMHDIAIVRVFDAVEKSSDFVFAWDSDIKKEIGRQVSIRVSNAPIHVVMDHVLDKSGLTYRRLDKQIVVYKISK